jgi:hypothetical protein
MKPAFELSQILEQHWPQVETSPAINSWQLRTLSAIRQCRTAALGGHVDACSACGHVRISYNSCRNRHCPKCQNLEREEWMLSRENELLPVPYFHLVFTLPDLLNPLALHQPAKLYKLLFDSAWQTVKTFASDHRHLGAKAGMIAILHTWGQTLSLHPHLHCIVPGGGITKSGKWKLARSRGKFLFPVKAMSSVFRAKFVAGLRKSFTGMDPAFYQSLFEKPWVVYAKCPFMGPQQVIEYLGRYTHKVAISNHRLLPVDKEQVTFGYKDYRQEGKKKSMSLAPPEFIRRFSLHILPGGFVRIRHFGFLSSRAKPKLLPLLMAQTGKAFVPLTKPQKREMARTRLGLDLSTCPCCKSPTMVTVCCFIRAGPAPLTAMAGVNALAPAAAQAG